jgi:hypothetical protein
MKTLSCITKLASVAAFGTLFLTGCASSYDNSYTSTDEARSQLAFTPVTNPEELVKWNSFYSGNTTAPLMGIDTYTMLVPVEDVDVSTENLPEFSADLPSGSVYMEAAGAERKAYRIIRHTPNQR